MLLHLIHKQSRFVKIKSCSVVNTLIIPHRPDRWRWWQRKCPPRMRRLTLPVGWRHWRLLFEWYPVLHSLRRLLAAIPQFLATSFLLLVVLSVQFLAADPVFPRHFPAEFLRVFLLPRRVLPSNVPAPWFRLTRTAAPRVDFPTHCLLVVRHLVYRGRWQLVQLQDLSWPAAQLHRQLLL